MGRDRVLFLILEVDGESVTTADRLQDVVTKSRIGQPLQLKVQQNGKIEQLSVRPTELRDAPQN
jgi:S1-C subfamily serine protease